MISQPHGIKGGGTRKENGSPVERLPLERHKARIGLIRQVNLRVTEKVHGVTVLGQDLARGLRLFRILIQRGARGWLAEGEFVIGAANHPWLGVAGGEQGDGGE